MERTRSDELLALLGLSHADLARLRDVPYSDAVLALAQMKTEARSRWKKLAFALHPDRTGNDPEKTALFRDLTRVRETLEGFTLPEPPPPPPPVRSFPIPTRRPHGPGKVNARSFVTMKP